MGSLSGYKYREVVAILKLFGFSFYRQAAGSHEIWYNPQTRRFTTIPNHPGDIPEGTLKAILKQADISLSEFVKAKRTWLFHPSGVSWTCGIRPAIILSSLRDCKASNGKECVSLPDNRALRKKILVLRPLLMKETGTLGFNMNSLGCNPGERKPPAPSTTPKWVEYKTISIAADGCVVCL